MKLFKRIRDWYWNLPGCGFWRWLEEEHPVIDHIVWCCILAMSVAALIKSFFF